MTFGHYEQDNDTTNGLEEIEWLVLDYDAKNNRALLISRYALDAKPYNVDWLDMTWEECTLRAWLNNDFLSAAFTAGEQSAILTTEVDNSMSQGYSEWSVYGGKNTQDKVFLLSCAEARKYFSVEHYSVIIYSYSNVTSRVKPTAYAIRNGAPTSNDYQTADGEAAGWWWLRSPGSRQNYTAYVFANGSLYGDGVNSHIGSVRPAIWLDLNVDILNPAPIPDPVQ